MIDLNNVNLEPEQLFISNYLTVQHDDINKIFVQGVAGSGKTTIALKTIEKMIGNFETYGKEIPSIVFITFNEKLVSYCKEALMKNSLTGKYLNQSSEIQPNSINVKRLIDLIIDTNSNDFLDDDKALGVITKIRKKFITLPYTPSQIFRAVTYLKDMSPREIEEVKQNLPRDEAEILENVKQYFYNKYLNYLKRNKLKDRADVINSMLNIFNSITIYRDLLNGNHYTKKQIKISTNKRLGDQDKLLNNFFIWVDNYLKFLEEKNSNDGISQLRSELTKKSLKNWGLVCKKIKSGLQEHGFRGNEVVEKITKPLIDPIFIVDEIQDYTRNEIKLLLQLWYSLPRKSYKNKILFLGDLNQMITPTGFSWEFLYDELKNYLLHSTTLFTLSNG